MMSKFPQANSAAELAQLERLFFGALRESESERAAYLKRVCGNDLKLRVALETMLRADKEGEGLVDTGLRQVSRLAERAAGPDEDDAQAMAGIQIGNYRLLERIGVGGMGSVWRAVRTDDAFDRTVAVKLIKRGMDSDEILRRFRLERQILAKLEHPNIARLYDGGATDDGRPYLVMECIDGIPIHEYCLVNKCGLDQVLGLVRTVCAAVQFAHSNLVIHRDIKPGNVLVTVDGRVKLLDFGIAKLLDDDGASMTITADFAMLTPRYASPEQLRGEVLTTSCDIYSLGVLLYELLTGESPYGSQLRTRHEIENAILNKVPTKASDAVEIANGLPRERRRVLARKLRGDIDTIVGKSLQKSPGDRYSSAEQLGLDISRTQEGLPLLARKAGTVQRAWRMLRRNRKGLIATSAVGLIAVALTATAVTYAFMAPRRAQAHVREAHEAFLTPDFCNGIWVLTFNNAQSLFDRELPPSCSTDLAALAIENYDSALRLDPSLNEVRLERETVWLAAEISGESGSTPQIPKVLLQCSPVTCEFAQMWARDGAIPELSDDELDRASTIDLRCLGLMAMLCKSERDCLRAWSRLGDFESDPLVESLLGVLYLALDEPQRAYPRLLSGYRAFPELGFLCTYLADAALRSGDLALAGRLITRAETLGHRDPLEAHKRVRIQYYLATGQEDRAAHLFDEEQGNLNFVTCVQYARHFFETGRRRRGLDILGQLCDKGASDQRVPALAMRAMFEMTQRWWNDLDEVSRAKSIETAFDEPNDKEGGLFRILRTYQASTDRVKRFHAHRAMEVGAGPLAADSLLATDAHRELLAIYDRLCKETQGSQSAHE